LVYNTDTMSEISEKLRRVTTVITGQPCTAYALDGRVPEAVVQPASTEEVREALDVCRGYEAPGVVWGGGTHIGIGNPMPSYRWAMDMRALSRLVDYAPGDVVVTVEAGMSLSTLQNFLRPHRQWLPIDAPLPDKQTVGGVVATNGAGPRRHRYGLPREWLLAVRAVLPSGEVVKAGVGVVKNVAGYDLPRLFAGSWGTLGVLTEMTFKVASLPEVSCAYRSSLPHTDMLPKLYHELNHPLLQPEMLDVVCESKTGWSIICGLAGFEEDVRWQFDLLRQQAPLDWEQISPEEVDLHRDRYLLVDAPYRCRCVVPSASTPGLLIELSRRFPEAAMQAHFGAGVVRIWWRDTHPDIPALQRLREQAHRWGGFCVVESAPTEVKRFVGVWGEVGGSVDIMRRLKKGFDPQNILASGRFVEGR
jgi:glycolate oxidase FAD binding subunit